MGSRRVGHDLATEQQQQTKPQVGYNLQDTLCHFCSLPAHQQDAVQALGRYLGDEPHVCSVS